MWKVQEYGKYRAQAGRDPTLPNHHGDREGERAGSSSDTRSREGTSSVTSRSVAREREGPSPPTPRKLAALFMFPNAGIKGLFLETRREFPLFTKRGVFYPKTFPF